MIKRSCDNCFWNNDFPCEDLGNVCAHHRFLEGLRKNFEVVSSIDYNSKENIFIIEYAQDEKILKVLRITNLGEDGYYNYMISLFDNSKDLNNLFKMSFQPFDNEDIYECFSEFYDSINSKNFDSIDDISLNNFNIKKENEIITLEFTKCDFGFNSPKSVDVFIGDCFSCFEFESFDELYDKLSSISSENKKVQEKVLKLHW